MTENVGSRLIRGNASDLENSRGYITGLFRDEQNHPELRFGTVEVTGIVTIPEGDQEAAHYHQIQTEVVFVIEGSFTMHINDSKGKRMEQFNANDFFIVEPGVIAQNFGVKPNTKVFLTKFPSVDGGDKIVCDLDGNPVQK